MKEHLIQIKEDLQYMIDNSNTDPDVATNSICDWFSVRYSYINVDPFNVWVGHKTEWFESWDKFSGDIRYPIPSSIPMTSPRSMFEECCARENFWLGEQGYYRTELCKHIIKCIDSMLEDLEE